MIKKTFCSYTEKFKKKAKFLNSVFLALRKY